MKWSWSFRVPAIVVGSHSYSFRLAAWAANGSIMSNPTMAVWDMGASSTI
jgi:hypothetical protein